MTMEKKLQKAARRVESYEDLVRGQREHLAQLLNASEEQEWLNKFQDWVKGIEDAREELEELKITLNTARYNLWKLNGTH